MSKDFELFHLSLKSREDLIRRVGAREKWIRTRLSEPFPFLHRRNELHWVPLPGGQPDSMIIGHVQRKLPRIHHRAPAQGGEETVSEDWQGALVVIDPAHHDDGQKVAFEIDQHIGRPLAVITSLMAHLNRDDNRQYDIQAKAILDKRSFKSFARRNSNKVRWISFELAVPNMWGTSEEFDEALKRIGQDTNAEKVKFKYESKDGVKTNSKEVEAAVDYSVQGAGTIKAKALDGELFNSSEAAKKTKIESGRLLSDDVLGWVTQRFNRILGRE